MESKEQWETPEGKAALSYANNNLALAKAFMAGIKWSRGEKLDDCSVMYDKTPSCPPQPETTYDPLKPQIEVLDDGTLILDFNLDDPNASFEAWWGLYGKKRGKKKSLQKWLKMSQKQRYDCIAATPAYVKSTPYVQFRKDPQTYLNGECYYDEILTPHDEQRQQYDPYAKAASILSK